MDEDIEEAVGMMGVRIAIGEKWTQKKGGRREVSVWSELTSFDSFELEKSSTTSIE